MASRQVTVEFLGNDRSLSRTAKDATTATSKLSSVLAGAGRAAAIGLGAGAVAGAVGLAKLTKGAMEDEAAQKRLAAALQRTTGATSQQIAGVEKWITAQGKALGVADDDLRPALEKLAASTGSVTEAQELASVAMDVAAARGVTLESVAKALERAQNGTASSLSRLGIKTKDANDETVSFEEAVRRLSDTYGGAASEQAETLEGKIERLKLGFAEAGETIGARLIPYVEDFADVALDRVVPAIDAILDGFDADGLRGAIGAFDDITASQGDLAPVLMAVRDAAGDVWTIFSQSVLPTFSALSGTTTGLLTPLGALDASLDFLADHADLARVAFATLLGVMAYNKLAPVVAGVGQLATNMRQASVDTQRLAAASKQAAGAAGLAALIASSGEANGTLRTLGQTAGGAALGWSVGGPWGAAVGAGAGLLGSLASAGDRAREAFRASITVNEDYAASFDAVTGAVTRATRETIFRNLQNQGALDVSRMIGIPDREMVSAVAGDVDALERVVERVRELTGSQKQLTGPKGDLFFFNRDSAADFISGLKYAETQLTKEQRAFIDAQRAADTYKESLKAIPPRARTAVEALGLAPAIEDVRELKRRFDLTPKEVRSVIRVTGLEEAARGARKAKGELEGVGRARPNLNPFIDLFGVQVNKLKQDATVGGLATARNLEQKTNTARPDLSPLAAAIRQGTQRAAALAGQGGSQIALDLKGGVLNGIFGLGGSLAAKMAAAVNQGIQAARDAAEAKSPSRKMIRLGQDLVDGAVVGVNARAGRLSAALRSVVGGAIGGGSNNPLLKEANRAAREVATKLAADLGAQIAAATSAVRDVKRAKGKDAKEEARDMLREIAGKVGQQGEKALERMKDLLGDAKERLRGLRDEASSFATGFRAFTASVFGFSSGSGDSGPYTYDGIPKGIKAALSGAAALLGFQKEQQAKAELLAKDVKTLIGAGISDDLLRQLQASGDAGIDNIRALAEAVSGPGGGSLIAELNASNAATLRALDEAGTLAADKLYAAAIADTQVTVDRLTEVRDAIKDSIGNVLGEIRDFLRGKGGLTKSEMVEALDPLLGEFKGLRADLLAAIKAGNSGGAGGGGGGGAGGGGGTPGGGGGGSGGGGGGGNGGGGSNGGGSGSGGGTGGSGGGKGDQGWGDPFTGTPGVSKGMENLLNNAAMGGVNSKDKVDKLKDYLKENTNLDISQINKVVNGNASGALLDKVEKQAKDAAKSAATTSAPTGSSPASGVSAAAKSTIPVATIPVPKAAAPVTNVAITVKGDTDPLAAARRIQTELLKLRRVNGGTPLGLA